jgi:mono/diheme cytochrome c family protein
MIIRYAVFLIPFITLLPTSLAAVDFAHDVMPVLRKHCAECHAGASKKGGLAINTRAELLAGGESGSVVIPGDAARSRLIELLESTDDAEWMPPKGPRVSAAEIQTLKNWISEGPGMRRSRLIGPPGNHR